jgi:hypothetical protein
MIDAEAKVARNPNVAHHELGGDEGSVLLHLESGAYFGLNTTGSLIWQLLDQPMTVAELLAHLRSRLPEAPPELESDVQAFLDDLRRREIVRIVPD